MILGNKNKKSQKKTRFIRATILGCLIGISFGYVKKFFEDHYRIDARYRITPNELQQYKDLVNIFSDGTLGKSDIKLGFRTHRPNLKYLINMKSVIGSCNYIISDLKYEIDIYRDYWKFITFKQKMFLVAHELKHCECKYFKHKNTRFPDDKCPTSFMNESLVSDRCLKKRLGHYLSELKNGCI